MPTKSELPPELRDLLSDSIRSIEEIDVLLKLKGLTTSATAPDLARHLATSEAELSSALEGLVNKRLVVRVGQGSNAAYCYAPEGAEARKLVDLLADSYEKHRLQILVIVSNNAIARLRQGMVRMLADTRAPKRPKKPG